MSPFVLDCSVSMAWCFEDECDQYADAVLGALGQTEVFVPAIWPLEVANVLLAAERRKRLKKADTARFVELLGGLPIVVEWMNTENALSRVLANGREYRLSSYDAAYLELAIREGAPLATVDRRLGEAAQTAGVLLQ